MAQQVRNIRQRLLAVQGGGGGHLGSYGAYGMVGVLLFCGTDMGCVPELVVADLSVSYA